LGEAKSYWMGNYFSFHDQLSPIPYSSIKRGSNDSKLMSQRLSEYGFVVLALEESDSATIDNMFEAGKKFFSLDKEAKAIHADPKDEAMGYVNVEGIREHIKLRVNGDRKGNWPVAVPEYKEVYGATSNLLGSMSWNIFLELCDFAKLNPRPRYKEFTEDVLRDCKECVTERSAIAVIHYYNPEKTNSANTSSQLVDVCDAHTDTGILTLILCSQIAGLQIWDRQKAQWMEAEKGLIEKYKSQSPNQHLVVCIMGEKISVFTGAASLEPTLHRVMIKSTAERHSMLYFMDTAN